ncbi:zinc-binding dehydrogenase [Hirsutella rhossiliensis]|uniref:Zinc-binding dehydrogenase domain-containing protein n=1 Tax=Hirsutella rhossiliensis TaxID=111463 RepID=A0A9P8N8L2_9HYPO|nr:zinc-binding dehydrogenase domain-containing protein [Hirsutella rhossiliensis]KAH0966627.1 zinc-binding dehydrogenase domain-containing protein [Hirsutella rhossiliensis]
MPRVLTLKKVEGTPGDVYYPLQIKHVPKPEPGPHEVLVRLKAAALNHRDLFIRRHQYPAISFAHALLADGCGVVEQVGAACTRRRLLHTPVVLTPMRGWASDPAGPEPGGAAFTVTGASKLTDVGTAQDYVAVHEDEVEPVPPHLSAVEAAALPLVGLTAWRAVVTKAGCRDGGRNVLITGIGGGVALQALQFAVALGCRVYVTSGDAAKLDRARQLGAVAGVLYSDDAWDRRLRAMLPADRPFLDAVVDGAGAHVVAKSVKLLRPGGVIAQYGMTAAPRMDWLMQAVLANVELKGTTMGSRSEFADMVAFVRDHKLKPVVSRTVRGLGDLDAIDGLFADMETGRQFGKLVIEIDDDEASSKL